MLFYTVSQKSTNFEMVQLLSSLLVTSSQSAMLYQRDPNMTTNVDIVAIMSHLLRTWFTILHSPWHSISCSTTWRRTV